MPEFSRDWYAYAFLLVIAAGCESGQDGVFRTYKDPADDETATTSAASSSQSPSGIVPATAESVKAPPDVAGVAPVVSPQLPDTVASPVPANLATTALPTEPVAPPPSTPELALTIPPVPPLAVPLTAAQKPGPGLIPVSQLQLLIPEKTFSVEGPEGAIRITFDDIDLLKVLNVNPVPLDIEQHLPAWLSGLHGKRIVLRGWMYPPNQESDIPAFMFVRDNEICCFGRKPLVYDKLAVTLREGQTTHYIQGRPFDVHGIMVVKSRIIDGEWFWLYMINDAVVLAK